MTFHKTYCLPQNPFSFSLAYSDLELYASSLICFRNDFPALQFVDFPPASRCLFVYWKNFDFEVPVVSIL